MEKSIDSYFTEILGVTYTNPRGVFAAFTCIYR